MAILVKKSVVGIVAAVLLTALAATSPASAESSWWHLTSGSRPTNLKPEAKGEIVVTVANLGDAGTNGEVSIVDQLPARLKATAIEGLAGAVGLNNAGPVTCEVTTLTCKFAGTLPPFDQIEVDIGVDVEPGASSGELNEVSVSGGEAQSVSIKRPITIGGVPTPFGVEDYELTPEEVGGASDTQAGSHPFQLTTTFTLNQTADANPASPAKDLHFKLPPGLIGNPAPFPQCTLAQFDIIGPVGLNECSPQTAVGVAIITINGSTAGFGKGAHPFTVPVFNLEPQVGEPARFGFLLPRSPVFLDTSVRTGGDYGVTVNANNITQTAAFIKNEVTFWGVPGDPRHDNARGWGCLADARKPSFPQPCPPLEARRPAPLLTLPTSCTGPLQSSVEADSWVRPGDFLSPFPASEPMPAMDGCNRLPFIPEIKVSPDGQQASDPTGLTVDVHVPQEGQLNGEGVAQSNIQDIAVTLPEGVTLNPSAADGLQACSEAQIGYLPGESHPPSELRFTPTIESPFCPDAAKVGTVKIKTPLLPNPLEGAVYLASPQNFAAFPEENPFSSLVAMYILARDPVSGVLVKLPGKVTLNETSGQISSTFENTPQLAFEDAEIHFFGSERAPLATPAHCGTYATEATFTPWSANPPVRSTSIFQITSGPSGTPCPGSALPFSPTLAAGSPNINAGSFSPLTTTISRADGNQNIQTVQLHMAPGMSGILAGVPLCPEAQANAGTCGPESQIGETIVSVGLGGDPFTVTGGKVYLTEKYQGGAFGLSIVNPADAGPFHLGKVIVRARIEIDPRTAALTITTGNIPHIIDGFPLQIKHVNVLINRPGFTFNPTNCNPQSITGTIGSVEGASSPVSVPFQVTNCALLKFTPNLTVTTAAKTSKANGASLFFKISYPKGAQGSQSWFNTAKFDIPKQLPARLTTIQKACLAKVFEANPAACPPASVIGHAVVHTQVLPVPLEGPVYFVSYGNAKFPDAVIVLQGYGITVYLHGETFINGKTNVTSATFASTPDVPFESIEVTVPSGPFSEFAANLPAKAKGSLCGQKLVMPTRFKAQNGLEITQNTPIGVTGCPKAKTRAQLYAAALKACHKDKNKTKRKKCEATARRKYGPIKKKK